MDDQARLIEIIKEISEGNYYNDIMGFTRPECPAHIREIETAGLLHDIGKIGFSDRAYQKGKSPETAFKILEKLGRHQLDSGLVALFIPEIREKGMEEAASAMPDLQQERQG